MLPNVNAVQYNEVKESIEKSVTNDFKELNNQIKYLINTLTNNIVINILLVLLFVWEIYLLIIAIITVVMVGYELNFIEKLLAIFFIWIWGNLDHLGFFIVDIMDYFNLDWFPLFNILKILYQIIEEIIDSIMGYNSSSMMII
jgi:hypothetical protein